MGISSNQARLMTLTARQHDLELRAQQISAKKMITSMESQQMATEYSDALNKYSELKASGDTFTRVTVTGENGEKYILNSYDYDPDKPWEFSQAQISAYYNAGGGCGSNVKSTSQTIDAETLLHEAQAKYDTETAKLSAEEKQLDMELTQINTEHEAVKTEYDSVKSLVSDNTDKSFNVFS